MTGTPSPFAEIRKTDSSGDSIAASPGQITTQQYEAVATVTLCNPRHHNALSEEMWSELHRVLDLLDKDPSVRAIVVTGGDLQFSAGGEIDSLPENSRDFLESRALAVFELLTMLRKPVIAAIAGNCIGGGAAIALGCDVRIAARDARIGITPAKLGLSYDFTSVRQLFDLVGPGVSKDLLMTGRLIDAEEALRIGFANQLVNPGDVVSTAQVYAASIARNAPLSVEGAKAVVNALVRDSADEARALARRVVETCVESADFKEGKRAFTEKRRPDFRGR